MAQIFFLFTFLVSWMYNYILYMYIWFCADRKASRALLETTWQPKLNSGADDDSRVSKIHKEMDIKSPFKYGSYRKK